jgi:putative endonuclease
MASKRMGTLYVGSTSDLIGRVWEHKNKAYPKSFTAKYKCDKLVYYEYCGSLERCKPLFFLRAKLWEL